MWSEECESVFQESKSELLTNRVLVHYDSKRALKLHCDASQYGVGVVLSHVMDNGEERPIAFASRSLKKSETNYAQLEKVALAMIFGVKNFHKYLYGRSFTLATDHRPLVTILGPTKAVPQLGAARMQRWALILQAYSYDVEYRPGSEHCNADALSRLPCKQTDSPEAEFFFFSSIEELPISAADIGPATRRESVLTQVLKYTLTEWPNYVTDEEIKPYFTRKHELSTEQGCLLWGTRTIIPNSLRIRLLRELHEEHQCIVAMKAIARRYMWWPRRNDDIEAQAQSCQICQTVQTSPPVAPLYPWTWPKRVWQSLHINFAEKDGNNLLVVIDSHSKWLEVKHTTSTTSQRTTAVLRDLFSSYGLPEEVVSDNGPQFVSHDFTNFMKMNGIKHTLTPPYHPASNVAAEHSVQILKQALRKQVASHHEGQLKLTIEHRLANVLFRNRNTPNTVTCVPPAELFLKRQPHIRLFNLLPSVEKQVNAQQAKQKLHHDRNRVKMRDFAASDSMSVRNTQGTYAKWLPGTVIHRLGPLTYLVKVGHRQRFVHIDHLLQAHSIADPVLDAEGVEPTLDKSTVSQDAAQEQTSVFPEKSSQLCLSPEKSSQLRVSPEKS